jgi:hypothetical protein
MKNSEIFQAMETKQTVWSDFYGKPCPDKIVYLIMDYRGRTRVQLFGLILGLSDNMTSHIPCSADEIFATEKECWDSIPDDQKHKEEYAEFLTKEAAK